MCKGKWLVIALLLSGSLNVYANDQIKAEASSALNRLIPSVIERLSSGGDVPEWLSRTDLSIHFEENLKPEWEFETLQPIYHSDQELTHNLFYQLRQALSDDEYVGNLGLGYRYLTLNKQWVVGLNVFYDQSFEHDHKRYSVGGEILGPAVSLHTNVYNGISGTREFMDGSVTVREKALDGYDVQLSTQVPFLPWAYLNINGFHWDANIGSDLTGVRYSALLNITRNISLEFGKEDDNQNVSSFAQLKFTFGLAPDVESTLVDDFIAEEAFTYRDMSKQVFSKVKRTNTIVVEQTRSSNVQGIVIARGT